MASAFLGKITKLIDDEADRISKIKSEELRLQKAAIKDKNDVDSLQPKIKAKLGDVSAIWNRCLNDIHAKTVELGFLADLSGGPEREWYTLQVNFHLHSPGSFQPLKLTVTERGQGQLSPNGPRSFDFLPADDAVFEDALFVQVENLFHKLRNDQITASRIAAQGQ